MPYFECLRCGSIAVVEGTPPRCAQCGYGTGIIHQNEPRSERNAPEINKKKESGEPGLEAGPASA